jgi:hypothetical protein
MNSMSFEKLATRKVHWTQAQETFFKFLLSFFFFFVPKGNPSLGFLKEAVVKLEAGF